MKKNEEVTQGSLILRISLTKKNYRLIRISTNATYHDLHLIIQELFDGDNDHLYGFAHGMKYYGSKVIVKGNPFKADEVRIIGNEMNQPGMLFSYLYDFGENELFTILVDSVLTEDIGKGYELLR